MKNEKIEIRKNDVIYVDIDGVLVQSNESREEWNSKRLTKGFFLDKKPVELATEAFKTLFDNCDLYILSTPVWDNVYCWSEKRIWVEEHLGSHATKRLILSHNKALNMGKILIDHSFKHGVKDFSGIHIHFGSTEFPSWKEVMTKLKFIG
jgi:5'(3')-deoxyribonucleotidase